MSKPSTIENEDTKRPSTKIWATDITTSKDTLAISMYLADLEAIKSLEPPAEEEIAQRWVFLGPQTHNATLVLDLDETLVWSKERETADCDHSLETVTRPHARHLLERLSALYEIVVFTAAAEDYAAQIVASLDPEHKFIKTLLTRSHCIPLSNGVLVKDLRIFADRAQDKMLIVDNNVLSFAFNLPNGVPVSPFNEDQEDKELLFLVDYLEGLSKEQYIVQANQEYMGLVPSANYSHCHLSRIEK